MPTQLLLLGILLILHLPIFDHQYFLPTESQLLLTAERLVQTPGNLYTDVWSAFSPIVLWIYRLAYQLFGSYTLLALRVIRVLYLFICIGYFSGLVLSCKVYTRNGGLTPISLGLMVSTPWYGLETGPGLLVLFPVIYSFLAIMRLEGGTTNAQNLREMFWVGLWFMLSILISYRMGWLTLGFIGAYFFIRSPRASELVSFVGGMGVLLAFLLLILYYSGNLRPFLDQAFFYEWGRRTYGLLDRPTSLKTWNAIILNWGPWILLASLGFAHFRLRYFSYVVKIRQIERIMGLWLVFGIIALFLSRNRLTVTDFLPLAPPISFYGAKVFDLVRRKRMLTLIGLFAFLPAAWVYVLFWSPNIDAFVQNKVGIYNRGNGYYTPTSIPEDQAVSHQFLKQQDAQGSVWVLADWPRFYLQLDALPSNRYTSFGMLAQRSACWGAKEANDRTQEPMRTFFLHMADNLPTWIVDPHETFPKIQACYPALFSDYVKVESPEGMIYKRNL